MIKTKHVIITLFNLGILLVLIWGFATDWKFKCTSTPSPLVCKPSCPTGKCNVSDGCGGTCKCPSEQTCVNQTCATPGDKSTKITAECLFSAPDPLNPTSVITNVNTWMNSQVALCGKGDVIFFATDYMAFDDDTMELIDTAVGKGVVMIIGIDRQQIGGGAYKCGGQNWCCGDIGHKGGNNCKTTQIGQFTCQNDKGIDDCDPGCINGCTCFLCGTNSCQAVNSLLSQSNIASQCGKNVIILDCPFDAGSHTEQDTKLHSHRKVCSFYRKTGPTSVYKGSWNIAGRKQIQAGGLRESGVGMTMETSSNVAQYFLMADMDMVNALKSYMTTPSAADQAVAKLKTIQTISKYPTVPMKAELNWSGPDPSYPSKTISGTDKNIDIYYGVAPSPENPQLKYPNSTKTMSDSDIVKMKWADGGVWSGTVLDKFFTEAKNRSKYIKLQMYFPDITANVASPKGLYNIFPPVPQAVIDHVKSGKDNNVQFLLGWYGEPGSPDPMDIPPSLPAPQSYDSQNDFHNHWFMRQLENVYDLTLEQKRRLFIRFFYTKGETYPNAHFCNSSGNGCKYYSNCQVCTASGEQGCCKAHDKLFISEVGVEFSSGQITSGYYNDLNWMNDDILFLNTDTKTASTFAAYWTSWFNLLYKVSSLPPDQNPNLADPTWNRNTSISPPDAFNCRKLLAQDKIKSKYHSDIDKLNCFMNFPTLYSTEDKYKDKSYLSWTPTSQCPGGKSPRAGNSTASSKYQVFC